MELGILLPLHILASVIWVGGMFFAIIALRPAATALDTGAQIRLWQAALSRFFTWTWIAVVVLLATGFRLVAAFYGGMRGLALHINLMMTIGLLMAVIFAFLFFVPYGRFRRAAGAGDDVAAAAALRTIRLLVTANLHLGVIAVVIGSSRGMLL